MGKFQEDFISDQGVKKNIAGREFLLRELNGSETDKIMTKCIKVTEDENMVVDLALRNENLYKTIVVDAPYEKDGKPFRQLTPDERYGILIRLKGNIRKDLLNEMLMLNGMGKEDTQKK